MGRRSKQKEKEEYQSKYEKKLLIGTKIRDKETNKLYTIVRAVETNNQWGYGIYLYYFKEQNEFGLYRSEFDIIGKKK